MMSTRTIRLAVASAMTVLVLGTAASGAVVASSGSHAVTTTVHATGSDNNPWPDTTT
jgi:hypothetical protein